MRLHDRRLAHVVRRCKDIPGQELFQYIDGDGQRQSTDSTAVNSYLQEISGGTFTAKDFRTWAGTVLAMSTLRQFGRCESQSETKRNVVRAIATLAEHMETRRRPAESATYTRPFSMPASKGNYLN